MVEIGTTTTCWIHGVEADAVACAITEANPYRLEQLLAGMPAHELARYMIAREETYREELNRFAEEHTESLAELQSDVDKLEKLADDHAAGGKAGEFDDLLAMTDRMHCALRDVQRTKGSPQARAIAAAALDEWFGEATDEMKAGVGSHVHVGG